MQTPDKINNTFRIFYEKLSDHNPKLKDINYFLKNIKLAKLTEEQQQKKSQEEPISLKP